MCQYMYMYTYMYMIILLLINVAIKNLFSILLQIHFVYQRSLADSQIDMVINNIRYLYTQPIPYST